ncbi:Fms-interacting protein-domain-containing protein [Baffinella frigidus]|nr:Fms-interacting protein-domain-containing protein [Cryptophyta sp. CCMP2293]|mmetsp:Transcript_51036/g.120881  ORF Transcript_51036/g.120881 Transcript_51036/m.120881 type:complete len:702 (-) Transcript_51036:245-2350(-)
MQVEGTALSEIAAFSETCSELRAMVTQLVEGKRGGGSTEGGKEKGRDCLVKMAELRKVNREAHQAADSMLKMAESERLKTDMVSQQLQNLQYQKIHLSRELHLCLSYKGTDGLEVVTEDDFEAATTAEQRNGERGSHAYELLRLSHEMKKREELIKSLKQKELRRKLYEGKLLSQRKFLDGMRVHLDDISDRAEPVRKEFSKVTPMASLERDDSSTAGLLPAPLYAIYYQAHAYEVCFLDTSVTSIVGDTADAIAYVKAQAALPAQSSRGGEGAATGGERKKRRRGKGEEGEDGDRGGLTKAHPLAVAVEIPPREGDALSKKITLTFSYLPTLQVVTVKHMVGGSGGVAEAGLLQDLFPHDSGLLSPLAANDYLFVDPATRLPRRFSDKATSGRAYRWAQGLGCLVFPPRPSGDPQAKQAPQVQVSPPFADVFAAVRARVSLSAQVKATLRSLEKVSKGLPEVPGIAELSPNGVSLESLKDVTAEVLKDLGGGEEEPGEEPARAGEGGDAAMGEEEGEVDEPGAEGGGAEPKGVVLGTERDSQEAARAYHRVYRAVVRKGGWAMQAELEVPGGYPETAPIFSLTLLKEGPRPSLTPAGLQVGADPKALSAAAAARQAGEATDNALRAMEEEINVFAKDDAKKAGCPPAQLLVYQLWVLLHCASIYMDVEGGATVAARPHRGRDRRLPFLYSADANANSQRP